MANVGAVINNIRNIMRQDRGISGDAQRLEQLGWMLFLKIIDDKDKELEITNDDYVSVIPEKFQWRNWAEDSEGITGDELLNFIDNYSEKEGEKGLFATLRSLASSNTSKRAALIQEVFEGNNNYMKSGYEMRKVINKLNEIDFNKSEDKHIFGTIYENILQELRDAGNKGEYYTPRAVTQFMTLMIDPKLGEKVLDPAAGTGGFLTAAIDHVKEKYVRTPNDFGVLQNSVIGWEFKPVAYVLGLTNLILHDVDVPDYEYTDSLKREYNSISNKDRVDVILANPPFGASIAEGVETNFPATYRCRESADLFVVLMMQMLKKNGGRAAIVLPDGSITGDGVKARIREKLLTECNLHTIVRMPQSTFFPAAVSTNLLFFEKGSSTKEIWYYEHRLPEGQKSYSKTKPIRFEEFKPVMAWWNDRKESDVAWRVDVKNLKNWDLDIKNPQIQRPSYDFSFQEIKRELNEKNEKIRLLFNEVVTTQIQEKNTLKIKDIASVTKGKTGITKAIPGDYKMITLGDIDKTHNEYQFDAKAVIIQLVSSTGHGHASLRRVKYQEGKFALGNILCAVIPFDETKVLAKYLQVYLQFYKEELLVSQMRGMANVSLSINRIEEVKVMIPDIEKQKEIVAVVEKLSDIESLILQQLSELDKLRNTFLYEMFK